MGIANVIPGVSGGTIALITNIYEKLILSLKAFDMKALKLLLYMDFKNLNSHINLYFLITVFGGSIASVFSIASLFKYLFNNHPILIWAFFFGLILASIYYIGKRIKKWSPKHIIIFTTGMVLAIGISLLNPANENSNPFFVFLCGIIGVSGMMLPGLSGSFILILLGNYELLLVTAITELNYILLGLFFLGSIAGLLGFSHIIAWLLKKHKDSLLALLTGFILGSLYLIWPWKKIADSIIIDGKEKVLRYNWYYPEIINQENIIAVSLIILGIITIYTIEKISSKKI